MLCYKDKTFCTFSSCSKTKTCPIFFTEEDHKNALVWWGDKNYPVSIFTEKPNCYEEKECLQEKMNKN